MTNQKERSRSLCTRLSTYFDIAFNRLLAFSFLTSLLLASLFLTSLRLKGLLWFVLPFFFAILTFADTMDFLQSMDLRLSVSLWSFLEGVSANDSPGFSSD